MSRDPHDASADFVEELMIECLGVPEADQPAALADACVRHPQHATTLRRRLALLREIGVASTLAFTGDDELPERLGEFRILERLGAGGMGVVYRALQESLQREVALKLIRPERLYFPGSRTLFLREVQAVARMQHPGIVPIHVVGEERGIPYYAMELVRGRSLAAALAARGDGAPEPAGAPLLEGHTLGWTDACCEVARQVALALSHAHARGVVHRDVKPSNVMLSDDGRALLVDFGLASHGGGEHVTRTGSQPGSLAYMSPEQVRGERVDARTDVYSLGVTLYEMLTLDAAFRGDTEAVIRTRIERGEVVPVQAVRRGVPWDVATVCATAMAPERDRRYATAAELAADLRAVLAREPIAARRPGVRLRLARFVQRRPALAIALVLGVLLVIGVPTALLVQERRARTAIARQAEIARQVTDFVVELFGHADPHQALGDDVRVRSLVDVARQRLLDGEVPEPHVRAELLETLGKVYSGLHVLDRASELLTQARELRKHTLQQSGAMLGEVTETLGLVSGMAGDLEAAEQQLREAADLLRQSDPPQPSAAALCLSGLGQVLGQRGKVDEARETFAAALALVPAADARAEAAVLHRMGLFLREADGPAAAEPTLRQAVAILDGATPGPHIRQVVPLSTFGYCLFEVGRFPEAATVLQRALDLALRFYGPEHPLTAGVRIHMASLLRTSGQAAAAEPLLRAAIDAYRASLTQPDVRLARAELQLALLLGTQGRFADAQTALERVLDQCEQLGEIGREPHFLAQLNLGKLLLSAGSTAAGEDRLRTAIALGEQLLPRQKRQVAMARARRARALAAMGQVEAAVDLAAEAVADLAGARDSIEVGFVLIDQVQVLIAAGDAGAALAVLEELLVLLDRLGDQGDQLRSEALTLRSIARERTGARVEAAQDAEAALAQARAVFAPQSTLLVAPLRQAARMRSTGGKHDEAVALADEAVAIARRATGGAGETCAYTVTCLATVCLEAGRQQDALLHAHDSLRLLQEARAGSGPSATALVELLVRLGEQGADVDRTALRAAAERWLPAQHALRARVAKLPPATGTGQE